MPPADAALFGTERVLNASSTSSRVRALLVEMGKPSGGNRDMGFVGVRLVVGALRGGRENQGEMNVFEERLLRRAKKQRGSLKFWHGLFAEAGVRAGLN